MSVDDKSVIEALTSVWEGRLRAKYDVKGRWAQLPEGRVLFDLINSVSADTFIEIGTANGWTSSWASAAGAVVYTYDVVDRPKVYLDPHFPLPELKNRIHFFDTGSPACVDLMRDIPRTPAPAVFFIDGDHSTKGSTLDFKSTMCLFRTGDVIVFHDTITESGVVRTWRGIERAYPEQVVTYATYNGMGAITWRN